MSTTEGEYISAASCCTQLLWMKHQLEDYHIKLTIFPFSVIILLLFVCLKIQFYIQEPSILKSNTILLETMFKKESWIYNSLILNISGLTDIFTKPLTIKRFDFIKKNLNMHFVSN